MRKRDLTFIFIIAFIIISIIPLSSCTCTSVNGRVYKNCYGDLIPCADGTYDLGSDTRRWHEIFFDNVYLELRPDLDYNDVSAKGAPTDVLINPSASATSRGFSLPIWNGTTNVNEELYFEICVPNRWTEDTDIEIHLYCVLAGAEDDKDFKIDINWEHWSVGDVVPSTSNLVEVEQNTGVAAPIYKSYELIYTVDYDIDALDPIVHDDMLTFRIRRDYSTSQKDTLKEIIVTHVGVVFQIDKIGETVP